MFSRGQQKEIHPKVKSSQFSRVFLGFREDKSGLITEVPAQCQGEVVGHREASNFGPHT
jgi:hypothetical protein